MPHSMLGEFIQLFFSFYAYHAFPGENITNLPPPHVTCIFHSTLCVVSTPFVHHGLYPASKCFAGGVLVL